MVSVLVYLVVLSVLALTNGHIRLPVIRSKSRASLSDESDGRPEKLAADDFYTAIINLGENKQPFRVLLDTGSSTLFVPAAGCSTCGDHSKYNCQNTSLKDTFEITYGDDSNSAGHVCTDVITIADYSITGTKFGVADEENSKIRNDDTIDGILGLGYRSINLYLHDGNVMIAPTVFENLVQQHNLRKIFSCYFTRNAEQNFIDFGSSDKTYFEGQLNYFPVTKYYVVSTGHQFYQNWEIDMSSFSIAGQEQLSESSTALIDTGTNLIELPQNITESIFQFAGVYFDPDATRFTIVNFEDISKFPTLEMRFGETSYTLEPEDYIEKNDDSEWQVRVGAGDRFIMGSPFFHKYFVEFDMEENTIGFAVAKKIPTSR